MMFLRLLASDLSKFAAFLGKWLFLASTPVLLIVAASFHQAGRSTVEPLLVLAFVTAVFAATHLISAKLDRARSFGLERGPTVSQLTANLAPNEFENWDRRLEQEIEQLNIVKNDSLRSRQREAELWRQANPWGGYNPLE